MKWELDSSIVLSDKNGSYDVWVCVAGGYKFALAASNGVARFVCVTTFGKCSTLDTNTLRTLEGCHTWGDNLSKQIEHMPVDDAKAYLETVFILEEKRDFI